MANDLGLSPVLLRSVLLIAASPFLAPAAGGAPAQLPTQEAPPAEGELEAALVTAGLTLDRAAGVLSLPASVRVKNDLLEYLLVAPHGAAHESLFLTTVRPSLINAGLLLLGAEPGVNAYPEDLGGVDERGRTERRVHPPAGDGFFLYAGWCEQGESYFFRIEDLLRNLASGRSLRRHRWVYLGSRFAALKPDAPESFLADVEGNLINLSFFFQGNTLLTAALPECAEQTIWAANEWLLPPTDAPVRLFFTRVPLETLPDGLRASLPEVPGEAPSGAQPPGNGR